MIKRLILALAASITLSFMMACGRLLNPTEPSPITNSNFSILPDWSPCVVVHTPGRIGDPAFENQMAAIAKLQRAGRITWTRMGAHPGDEGLDYFHRARATNLKIFGIMGLHDLETYGWEEFFDRIYRTYPADIWEIAGEISNEDPNVNPGGITTPEVFMPKFKRLYEHVKKTYPGVVLTSPPDFGSGSSGAVELEKFIELGMLDMDIIIAFNVYTDRALLEYSDLFAKYGSRLAGKRIWITETGGYGEEAQIDWVENFYHRLVKTFNPEIICWYALWNGDQPVGDNPYGLITNVENGQPLIERPLFRMLTEGG